MHNLNVKMLDRAVDEYVAAENFSGVIRVTHRGRVIYERAIGYADAQSKAPFTRDSMFTLYSLSNPFCAIDLMELCDRGLVDLDAHPGKYLSEAKRFHKDLKIRQLLNHTSGIPDFVQTEEFYKKTETAAKKSRNYWRYYGSMRDFSTPDAAEDTLT